LAGERLDGALDAGGGILDGTERKVDRERRSLGFGCTHKIIKKGGCLGVGHESGAPEAGRDLLEHREPFPGDAGFVLRDASNITARPRQTRNKARADRVGDDGKYDRNRSALPL